MAASRLLWAIFIYSAQSIHGAPTPEGFSSFDTASAKATGCLPCHQIIPHTIDIEDVESLLLGPWLSTPTLPTTSSNRISNYQQYPFSFSYMMATASAPISDSALTITITKEEPMTVTVSLVPSTITKIVTVTAPWRTPVPTSTPTRSDGGDGATKTAWSSPTDMTDLSSFQVSKFAGGEKNMKIVPDTSVGGGESDSSISGQEESPPGSIGSAMQLLYPANSIDPAQKPQGGAEFYASPIDITDARNVTMGYSVFFPSDFDWVLGGKLPGLYGGHTGCSGGNAALDCFSTRLMWRQGGAGELYLYAPKDKQTKALCSDPASVCDAAYGLSVGRGLFSWQAGSWTDVKQTVYLNTPGKQDGQFTLEVNGERAIFRDDVFYRDSVKEMQPSSEKATKTTQAKKTSTKKYEESTTSTSNGDNGGLLGPILGGLLGIRRWNESDSADGANKQDAVTSDSSSMYGIFTKPDSQWPAALLGPTACNARTSTATATATATAINVSLEVDSVAESEVKFVGIFFSTFFGGHESKYATPQDQYVWFKDFSLMYND